MSVSALRHDAAWSRRPQRRGSCFSLVVLMQEPGWFGFSLLHKLVALLKLMLAGIRGGLV